MRVMVVKCHACLARRAIHKLWVSCPEFSVKSPSNDRQFSNEKVRVAQEDAQQLEMQCDY